MRKRPPPYVGMGPRMVNPALTSRRGAATRGSVGYWTVFHRNSIWRLTLLLTNWHFLLMGNGVFTCYSNWPVQISLRAKLIKKFGIISVCIPRKWRQKNHSEGSRGPSDTAGPGVAYPLTPRLEGPALRPSINCGPMHNPDHNHRLGKSMNLKECITSIG